MCGTDKLVKKEIETERQRDSASRKDIKLHKEAGGRQGAEIDRDKQR